MGGVFTFVLLDWCWGERSHLSTNLQFVVNGNGTKEGRFGPFFGTHRPLLSFPL